MSQITPVPGPSQADFDALNNKITTEIVSIPLESGVTSSDKYALRSANVVCVHLVASATYTINVYNHVATVSLAPKASSWYPAFNGATGEIVGLCRIDPDGKVRMLPNTSTSSMRVDCSYVIE